MLQLASGFSHSINYLDNGATGFIIAHEISRTVNQFVSLLLRVSAPWRELN
jgi:hypothetical protein